MWLLGRWPRLDDEGHWSMWGRFGGGGSDDARQEMRRTRRDTLRIRRAGSATEGMAEAFGWQESSAYGVEHDRRNTVFRGVVGAHTAASC